MRIAVFGGTGVTGRLLIAQALDEGDSVTAYARHPEKLAIVNDRLTVVEGELSDAAAALGRWLSAPYQARLRLPPTFHARRYPDG